MTPSQDKLWCPLHVCCYHANVLAYLDATLWSRANAGWVLGYAIERASVVGPVLGQIPRTRLGAWESAWVNFNP
jgi:hypothetical protein